MKEYNYKIKGAPYNVKIQGIEENIAKVEVNGIAFEVELEKPVAQPKPVVRAVAAPVKTIEAPKAAQEAVEAGVSAVQEGRDTRHPRGHEDGEQHRLRP